MEVVTEIAAGVQYCELTLTVRRSPTFPTIAKELNAQAVAIKRLGHNNSLGKLSHPKEKL